jgi:tetratricopeptide (TPR) repeat protein
VDFEHRSAGGSSRPRSAGLLLAALAALASLVALSGACATVPDPDPELAAEYDARGDALFIQGKLAEAVVEYREAARFEPSNAELWMQLGQTYEKMGRGEEALHSLETGVEADPGNAGLLNHLAWLYATIENPTLRDPAKAIAYAQRAVEMSNATDANILDTLAEAYYANQQFDAAIETEQRALEIAPELEAYQNQLNKFRDAQAAESAR